MKKIDSIYVTCNKRDLYFAKICIASIRYWNDYTTLYLIKDLSKGNFDTTPLEEKFDVIIEETSIASLGFFAKLHPLIRQNKERILIMDCDIVWMCDLVKLLQQYDEDIVIDGYSPDDTEAEKARWYFVEPSFSKHFPEYIYPGFLFNVGQMLLSTAAFTKEDLFQLIDWKENPAPKLPDTFFYEQGILNYLVAKKIAEGSATVKNANFHLWGWDKKVDQLNPEDIKEKKGSFFLIHWYGIKYGLISFLPGNRLLKFYEAFYYRHFPSGKINLFFARLTRTLKHADKFLYEFMKKVYHSIIPGKR